MAKKKKDIKGMRSMKEKEEKKKAKAAEKVNQEKMRKRGSLYWIHCGYLPIRALGFNKIAVSRRCCLIPANVFMVPLGLGPLCPFFPFFMLFSLIRA